MQNNNERRKPQQQMEQNPTVDAPGSKVSDYGNVEGGAGNEDDERSQRTTDKADRSGVEPLKGKDETMGTP